MYQITALILCNSQCIYALLLIPNNTIAGEKYIKNKRSLRMNKYTDRDVEKV